MSRTAGWLLTGLLLAGLATPVAAQRGGSKASQPAPLPVAVNTVTPGVVLVTWLVVQKAVAYEVARCETSACTFTTFPRISSGQPLEYRDNLTASGTWLYRVTAFSSRGLPLAEGQVAYVYTMPTAVLMPAPTGTITPMAPAGPSSLTAASYIPGQIEITWSPVPNATSYRILRASSGGEPEQQILHRNALDRDLRNGLYFFVNGPVDFRWTYTYRVQAVFPSATGSITSAASPAASAKSVPFVQVSGLRYTAVPSTTSPGRVDVTVHWDPVKHVLGYYYWDEILAAPILATFPTTSNFLPGFQPGGPSTRVCVGAVYYFDIRQESTMPCIEIKI